MSTSPAQAPAAEAQTALPPADSGLANQPAHPFVQGTRLVAVGSLLGLIVLGLAWELWLAPTGSRFLAFKVLPLVIPLAGLLKHRLYTYRWVSLLVWLYFTEGVVRAYSDKPPSNYLAMIEVVLCLVLFVACALHVRLRLKNAKAAALTTAVAPL